MKNSRAPRGYIALISMLILSAILAAVAMSAGSASYFARQGVLQQEEHALARARADSCAHVALLQFAEDPSYRPRSGGETVQIEPKRACTIDAVSASDTEVVITARAHEGLVSVEVEARATRAPLRLVSWKEINISAE